MQFHHLSDIYFPLTLLGTILLVYVRPYDAVEVRLSINSTKTSYL